VPGFLWNLNLRLEWLEPRAWVVDRIEDDVNRPLFPDVHPLCNPGISNVKLAPGGVVDGTVDREV
jgi:hypothetical protein